MTRTSLLSLILTVLFSLVALSSTALAQNHVPQTWSDYRSEQYKLGSIEVTTAGAAMTYDTTEICSDWSACEDEHGDCDMVFGGSRDPNRYDHRGYDNALQGGLAGGRASELQDAVNSACPAAFDDFRVGALISSKVDGYRYSWVKIQPQGPNLATLVHACNDGEDNDGDGKVDMTDPGCESPQDDDEWNISKRELYEVSIAAGRMLRDVSNRKCPWEITAAYDRKIGVTVSIKKTDPTCTCDPEGAFETEEAYEEALKAELENVPMTPKDPAGGVVAIDVLYNHYDSVRSVFTDDVGAEWNEGLFYTYGFVKITKTKNECIALARDEFLASYKGTDLVVGGHGYLGTSVLGDGTSLTSAPSGTLAMELGLESGSDKVAFLGTLGIGGSFDQNCDAPAAWMAQARVGAVTNRAGRVGLMVDERLQYSWGVSYAVTPDDPDTEKNEYEANPALGTNSVAFMTDVGPRFALQQGFHGAWIAPTLAAGPKLRWVAGDSTNERLVTLTADVGFSVMVGGTF